MLPNPILQRNYTIKKRPRDTLASGLIKPASDSPETFRVPSARPPIKMRRTVSEAHIKNKMEDDDVMQVDSMEVIQEKAIPAAPPMNQSLILPIISECTGIKRISIDTVLFLLCLFTCF